MRLLQLAAKLSLSFIKLLPGLFNLGSTGADGCLQSLGVLRPSLDQLILQLGGLLPLGLQLALVLDSEIVLGSYNPENIDLAKNITSEK
jgi:hypothetical protein